MIIIIIKRICFGISTEWLFIHCFQIELEFRDVDFWGGRKTGEPGEKPSARTRTNNKLNPHITPGLGNRTRATLVGGECSTTAPSLLPVHCPIPAPRVSSFCTWICSVVKCVASQAMIWRTFPDNKGLQELTIWCSILYFKINFVSFIYACLSRIPFWGTQIMSIALASEQKAINVSVDQKMALWDYGVWKFNS